MTLYLKLSRKNSAKRGRERLFPYKKACFVEFRSKKTAYKGDEMAKSVTSTAFGAFFARRKRFLLKKRLFWPYLLETGSQRYHFLAAVLAVWQFNR